MKEILKLGLVLSIFAVVSCFALAVVNNFTAPRIAAHKAANTAAGLKVVFAGADSFEPVSGFETSVGSTTIMEVYTAVKGGEKVGTVVKATGPTYDKVVMLIACDTNKKITGVKFLENTDSPGFGQKASEEAFYGQFAGIDGSKPVVMGTDFEAISGATITSKGVETIINNALGVIK
ncbi:MAG: FMN-binding protein [Treponema sp.]|nr:FMN-binding protein [Treponema sp.]